MHHLPRRTQVHTGTCRVIADRSDVRNTIGEQRVLAVRYLITVRWDTVDVHVGDVVTVTDAVDPGLIGRQFTVKEVRYGSQQWERYLYAEDDSASTPVLTDEIVIVRAPLVTGYGNSLIYDWANADRTTVAAALEPGNASERTGARDHTTTFYTAFVPARHRRARHRPGRVGRPHVGDRRRTARVAAARDWRRPPHRAEAPHRRGRLTAPHSPHLWRK